MWLGSFFATRQQKKNDTRTDEYADNQLTITSKKTVVARVRVIKVKPQYIHPTHRTHPNRHCRKLFTGSRYFVKYVAHNKLTQSVSFYINV